VSKELWICTKQLRKPIPRPFGLMTQPFELSARPADDIEIESPLSSLMVAKD
jgi:hypothetical protein